MPVGIYCQDIAVELKKEYQLLWAGQSYAGLDLSSSEVEFYGQARNVVRDLVFGVFDPYKLPLADMFFLRETRYWVGNQRVVDAVDEHSLKGFDFDFIGES